MKHLNMFEKWDWSSGMAINRSIFFFSWSLSDPIKIAVWSDQPAMSNVYIFTKKYTKADVSIQWNSKTFLVNKNESNQISSIDVLKYIDVSIKSFKCNKTEFGSIELEKTSKYWKISKNSKKFHCRHKIIGTNDIVWPWTWRSRSR